MRRKITPRASGIKPLVLVACRWRRPIRFVRHQRGGQPFGQGHGLGRFALLNIQIVEVLAQLRRLWPLGQGRLQDATGFVIPLARLQSQRKRNGGDVTNLAKVPDC